MTVNGREFVTCQRCSGEGTLRSVLRPGRDIACFLCNKDGAIPVGMAVEIALLGLRCLSQTRILGLRQRHGVVPRIWVHYDQRVKNDIDFSYTAWKEQGLE